MSLRVPTIYLQTGLLLLATAAFAADSVQPEWSLGPFVRPPQAEPVIRPNPSSVFFCPLRGEPVHWEKRHTFNPAAVVKDGKVFVLYRAEDDRTVSADGKGGIGTFTSRLGLAVSDDGFHFRTLPAPAFFPADDDQKDFEWTGGCEDPRLAERDDGTYVITYTQYSGPGKRPVRLGLASSRDLVTWTKHGSAFAGTPFENLRMKSAAIVHEIRDGRLVAAKIDGKYWMYFGEHSVSAATSSDLIHWTPLTGPEGKPLTILQTRPGFFDSGLTEVGPQAIRTDRGIVLIFNGKNQPHAQSGDSALPERVYSCGQALFDRDHPEKLLTRLDTPFFKPELPWEKSGQYVDGTTFAEGLVLFKGRWFLYYGCADTFVGVATAPAAP
jgi:predicted GH43/DUF377 family glycosyl hydrolase